MDYLTRARQVFVDEIHELQMLHDRLDHNFRKAVDLILEVVTSGHKLLIIGVGKSGNIGKKMAATFTSTGTPAVILDSVDALHGDLGIVADGDAAVMLSYSGETEETVRTMTSLKRFDVKIISITGKPNSTLANSSDIVLDVAVEREACPLKLAPTSSTTSMLVLGDALAMTLLEVRGFDEGDFARYHPGGSIGKSLLLKAAEIMRPLGETALVFENASVDRVIAEIAKVQAGAAVVLTDDNRLSGIFTQGDFLRAFRAKGADIGGESIHTLMTRNPLKINKAQLAVEVINLLRANRVDDLIVVDDEDHPVGLIDVQDLSRLRLI